MTFAVMHYFGIGLHKISLGALVLALGLLVDDAIIAVEMMAIKMEQGFDALEARRASPTRRTAFPMLTGTLVTAAGFLPIATAASSTGEYTRSMFQVVTIALVVSWIAAVVFIPYLGDRMLPDLGASAAAETRLAGGALARLARSASRDRWPRLRVRARAEAPHQAHDHDPLPAPVLPPLPRAARLVPAHRWLVIGATVPRSCCRSRCSASCRSSSSRIRPGRS